MNVLLKKLMMLFFITTIASPGLAQTITVTGTVTDEQGEVLPGVSIIQKGTKNGVITDIDGKYKINIPKEGKLIFTFLGFTGKEITPKNSIVNVTLYPTQVSLQETVVIGYGAQSRKSLTTAIAKLNGDRLEGLSISTLGEGLKGKLAGTRFYSTNNSPGEEVSIRIRGGSSINKSNDPLILVDGVERSFSGINNNDIKSIEVLKDAASTAIYGSRASNGVILVTTKDGIANQPPSITFEASIAMQSPETKYNFMNARDYINTVRPAVAVGPNSRFNTMDGFSASSGNSESSIYSTRYLNHGEEVPEGYQSMPDPLDPNKTLIFQDTDWQSEIYKTSLWQKYYAGINGGSKNVSYNASLGYIDDKGVALCTGYNRLNMRTNLNIKASDKLRFNIGLDYSKTKSEEFANQMNIISRGLSTPPTQKKYNSDGTPTKGYNATSPTPLFYQYNNNNNKSYRRYSGFGKITYYFLPEWKIESQVSTFNQNSRFSSFQKANVFNGRRPTEEDYNEDERNKLELYSTFKQNFKKHSFSLLAGYSYQQSKFNSFGAIVSGASTDKVPTLSAGPNKEDAYSDKYKVVTIGYFGRLSYDYLKRYFLTATFRNDASSLFAEHHRWGFFPGISAGWIMSDEPFMKNIKSINTLKLRASYGQTGNNSIGIYDALGRYSTDARYDGNAGIVPNVMPNPNLTWETTTQLDLGFDFNLLDNRLSVIFDYFDKRTNNLLFKKELPNTSGFKDINTNVGKVKFYGFDIEVSSVNIRNKDWEWTTRMTWSYVKNKVLKLPFNGRDKNRIGGVTLADGTAFGGIAEGEPMYRYYGFIVDHILQNKAAADGAMYDVYAKGYRDSDHQRIVGRKEVGDYEWKNRKGSRTKDGKEIIDSQDLFYLGTTVPTSTGGLGNTLRWKNLTFNLYLDWALGHSINHNSEMRYFMNTFANNYTIIDEVKKCWKQEGDNTKYARFTANDPDDGNANFSRTSNIFNYKGDYLCLREISLSYSFPKSISSKLGMQDLTISISGNNLHYFTAVRGVSPEIGTNTTYSNSYYNYPPIKKVCLGVKATF